MATALTQRPAEFTSARFTRTHHAMTKDLLQFVGHEGLILHVNADGEALVEFHPQHDRPQHRWIRLKFLDWIDV